MLTLAGVTSESVIYDLGCGNGDVVVAAVRDYHARKAVGIEQNQKLFSIAFRRTRHFKNAIIMNANYDEVDLSEASVVTLYQSASENARLKPKFLGELSEGSIVVSHDFGMEPQGVLLIQGRPPLSKSLSLRHRFPHASVAQSIAMAPISSCLSVSE